MEELVLTRFCQSAKGTFGRMIVNDIELFTVERPWLGNQPYLSCIPEGVYDCKPRTFFKGGYLASEIQEVPDRTLILFHRANTFHEVHGCIGVGNGLGAISGHWAVLESAKAFDIFMKYYGHKPFRLLIRHERSTDVRKGE